MSYKINRDDEHIVMPDGPITARQVKRYMKQQKTPEFYELEAAEVLKVLLDDEDLPFVPETGERDYSKYGYIHARMTVSNSGKQDIKIIAPLDPNIKDYPYPGEYVIVADYFGDSYYTQKINMRNNVHSNIAPGLSKVYNPFDGEVIKSNLPEVQNPKIRQLKAEEGDITFNGRFGNSIRLGSNVKEILTDDGIEENTGKENSPNVIIRAGQGVEEQLLNKPVKEDVNKDSSSLWMTTDQVVPFQRSSEKSHGKTVPKQYDGKQIIINSDRIVFNSKVNSIHAFSKSEISLGADRRMNLESPIVNLADRMATEPALGGDITMDLIDKLLSALISFATGIHDSKASVISFSVPIDNIIGPSLTLVSELQTLKTRMDEPKSKTVFVGNPNGPFIGPPEAS